MIWKMPVHGVVAETKQGARMMELQSRERRETILNRRYPKVKSCAAQAGDLRFVHVQVGIILKGGGFL